MLAVVALALLADVAFASPAVTPAPAPAPTANLVYDGTIASLSTGLTLSGPLYAEMAVCGEVSLPSGASAPALTEVDTLVGFTFNGQVAALATGLNVSGPIYADACFFGGTAYPDNASATLTSASAATLGWDGTTTSLTAGLNVSGPLYATACHCGGFEYLTATGPTTFDGVLNCGDGAGAAVWNPRLATGDASIAGNWIPSGVPDATVAVQIDATIGYDQFGTANTVVTLGSDLVVNSFLLGAGAAGGQGDVQLIFGGGVRVDFAVYDASFASACASDVTLADLAAR